jgi:hypothetical protein
MEVQASPAALQELRRALQAGQAIAVSDGSFKDGKGTAAVIVEGREDSGARVVLLVPVPGLSSQQGALRSELMGLLALVRWISAQTAEWELDSGAIAVACDNKAAVSAATIHRRAVSAWAAHFDIIAQVCLAI